MFIQSIGLLVTCLVFLVTQNAYAQDTCAQYRDRVIEPQPNMYSQDEEETLGESILQQEEFASAIDGGGIHDKEMVLLHSIEERLRPFFPDFAKQWAFHYKIIPNGTSLDAHAIPGGTILIHSGTFTAGSNVGVIAGVQAHEIAHVVLRHGTRRGTINMEHTQKVYGLLLQDATLLTMDSEKALTYIEQRVGPSPDMRSVIREQELEADIFANRVVASAGFDLGAHEKIHEDSAVTEDVSDAHPLHSIRAEIMRCFNNTSTRTEHPNEDALLQEIQTYYRSTRR